MLLVRKFKGFKMFITFEGIDGSGKSTQISLLCNELERRGLPFILTRQPGGTEIGAKIRQILLDPENSAMDPKAELLLYLADRVQHLQEVIRPALAEGKLVLCDRYHDATLAYQGAGRGLDLSWMEELSKDLILTPDLTIWMELDPKCIWKVRVSNGFNDLFIHGGGCHLPSLAQFFNGLVV